MRRALGALAVALGLLACKGQEVVVFDMPGGSGGQAGSSSSGGSSAGAGSPAAAGDMSGSGGVAGSADVTPPGGSGGMAGGGAGGMAGAGGMPLGMPCTMDIDCGVGWLCEKPGCDAPRR